MLAIIGGSGLARLPDLVITHRQIVRTPYGEPSGALTFGNLAGQGVVFLARHGYSHTLAPHEINYRANIWALARQNVSGIVGVGSVGGISAAMQPGMVAVPDQLLDYTWGRAHTFFEGDDVPVVHVDFTWPYDAGLRRRLLDAAAACGVPLADGGVYACVQGPRLDTAAEIRRLERDGADMLGMTGMPEAVLAREQGIPYASLCPVVNWAAGKGDSTREVSFSTSSPSFAEALGTVQRVLAQLVGGVACALPDAP